MAELLTGSNEEHANFRFPSDENNQEDPKPIIPDNTDTPPAGFVRLVDVSKATDYAEYERKHPEAVTSIAPDENYNNKYYELRWNETILLSDELTEEQRIQSNRPQCVELIGATRAGKSTVATTIERQFVINGIPCKYFSSDMIRGKIKKQVERQLAKEIEDNRFKFEVGSKEYADEREKRIYSDKNKQRVYDQLYKQAGNFMKRTGGVAIVDATHITEEKRKAAFEQISQAYDTSKAPKLSKRTIPDKASEIDFTLIEVSNSDELANQILNADAMRRENLRKGKGEVAGFQSSETPQNPLYLPYDLSEGTADTRKRDKENYEQIYVKHIKVINDFPSAEALSEHVRVNLVAEFPEPYVEVVKKPMDTVE